MDPNLAPNMPPPDPAPPNVDRQWSSQPPVYDNQPTGSQSNKSSKIIIFTALGVILVGLVIAALFLFNMFSRVDIDKALTSIEVECRPMTAEDVAGEVLDKVAAVLQAGEACTMPNADKAASAREVDTFIYIRTSKSQYQEIKTAIEEGFRSRDQSSVREDQEEAYRILRRCAESQLYSLIYRAEAEYDAEDLASQSIFVGERGVLFVGDYAFIDASFGLNELKQALFEEGLESEWAESICATLEDEIKSSKTQAEIDSDQHFYSYSGVKLPKLPIASTDYIFLDGFVISFDDASCWTIVYDIAYKGLWEHSNLERTFNSDDFYKQLTEAAEKLYPNQDPERLDIDIEVYKYNGSSKNYDYPFSAEEAGEEGREYTRSCSLLAPPEPVQIDISIIR